MQQVEAAGDDRKSERCEETERDTRCGLGSCRGAFLQRFATKKSYIFVYSVLGLFQSMFFSYSIATLTTVEKEFKFNSQTTGQWLGTIYIFAHLI